MQNESPQQKSNAALREEAILTFWKEKDIFKKSLEKDAPNGEFVFYEGPPTANAKPALHHLEARAFKDVMPRYKTMQGFHVRRRAGWDTHGLPVELQIEKKIGSQSKKDIEVYGIAKFNQECKESVLTYIKDWEAFTDRIGYWVDKSDAYYTFNPSYMESLWSILGHIEKRGLLYKDYKVVPWCPRCGTALASHELAQGYQDDKDLSVTAKFKIIGTENGYFLAWTTTPWTLPGNVALAVGSDITYVEAKVGEEILVLAKDRLSILTDPYEIIAEHQGSEMVGMQYEPLYPYLSEIISGPEKEKMQNAYKVYAADFVTTTDGTGIVHTAVMYGQDDFELGTKVSLPKFHTVDETGHFIARTDFLAARFVKDEDVAVDIIKDLAHRGLLFKKEKYEHSYPHCWRCKTPLIYYARDSWYIEMSKLRTELIAENEKINWEPSHIKEGRFGEWLREVKDWAISRERYWGTPLPIWESENKERLVVDSIDTLKKYSKKSNNRYFVMRHGEAGNNIATLYLKEKENGLPLTDHGKNQTRKSAENFKEKIDIVICSPYERTKQTAQIFCEQIGFPVEEILYDVRAEEWHTSSFFEGKDRKLFSDYYRKEYIAEPYTRLPEAESFADLMKRQAEFISDLESKYKNKTIAIIGHNGAIRALSVFTQGLDLKQLEINSSALIDLNNAEIRELPFVPLPHNTEYELDLHRPYIDDVILEKDGTEFRRVKEVMDVWFDSGAMPFAQDHYPFENKDLLYPADFISEAIDQTRGWFYTLHAIGVLMEKGKAYNNVICLGHLLDKDGKKMSKSIGNIVEPFSQIEKFGVDAVRFWMYSVNQPGDSKNYDEKTVDEVVKKVFNLAYNVLSFYELYRDVSLESEKVMSSNNILDQWIMARLNQLIALCTENLDNFKPFEPTRAIRDFIDDLSTWYLRRSRDRIKDGDANAKQTLYMVLKTLAQLMAPFTPFAAEDMWQRLKTETDSESVHLSTWPNAQAVDEEVLKNMQLARDICTEGNALRKKENIPVRQPLSTLHVKSFELHDEYKELIKEELNIKNVVAGEETKLDTAITPELKAEGNYRELVRAVQDLRKEKGLTPQDMITLTISPEAKSFLAPFLDDFKKTVLATNVQFTENSGSELKIDEMTLRVTIEK